VAADPEAPQADQPDLPAETLLPLVTGTRPILTAMRQLPEQARAGLPGTDWMLLCPLTVKEGHSSGALIGLIAVFAEQRLLADLSPH
jgi:hypothetical protein